MHSPRSILLTLLCLLILLPACGTKKQCGPPYDGENIEAWLDETVPCLLKENRVPGVAVAVVRSGWPTLVKGYGEMLIGSESPITPQTLFPAGGLANPLFAYGVLKLAEEKKLSLDTPLAKYLNKTYVEGGNLARTITARMVLSHTSGLPNWRPDRWEIKRDGIYLSPKPGPLKLRKEPGSEFLFSSEGYLFLQSVLEKLTVQPLDFFMKSKVLWPMRMAGGNFGFKKEQVPETAFPHDKQGTAVSRWQWRVKKPLAAGSLYISAQDYAKFLEIMLKDELAADMLEPQVEVKGSLSWSLGWGLEHQEYTDYFWHWGFNPGMKHFAAGTRPQGMAVLVMCNSENGEKLYQPIIESVLGVGLQAISWDF